MDSVELTSGSVTRRLHPVGPRVGATFDPFQPVMRSVDLSTATLQDSPVSTFQPEALEVLRILRLSIASTLADIGDFSKPADVHKTLQLDRTLARQLFGLASHAEAIKNGGMIPSSASIDRFLAAAEAHGVGPERLQSVRKAYSAFEHLVRTHAGDRATFNSMVSAANGVDDGWHATDLQHRRNAFRAMSHAVGVQAKTRLVLMIVNESMDRATYETAVLGGFIGLRILRDLPSVRVMGITTYPHQSSQDANRSSCGPIGLSGVCGGYVLEDFSSAPLPALRVSEGLTDHGTYREISLERPVVGKVGSNNLMFGSYFQNLDSTPREPMKMYASSGKPVETCLLDMLTPPDWARGSSPVGKATLGLEERFTSEVVELQGNFKVDYLGKGYKALATPEVPRYTEMLVAADAKLGWKLENYNAWRLRVEFPIYQSRISIEWPAAIE